MELYQRQQFDFFLMTAAERFTERVVQRNEGAARALARLRRDPDGEGVWLAEFVAALFDDFLLNNTAGACFILAALEKRPAPEASGGNIEQILVALARRAFAALLAQKVEEALGQAAMYGN